MRGDQELARLEPMVPCGASFIAAHGQGRQQDRLQPGWPRWPVGTIELLCVFNSASPDIRRARTERALI